MSRVAAVIACLCLVLSSHAQNVTFTNGFQWPNGFAFEVYCDYYQPLIKRTETVGGASYIWYEPDGDPITGEQAAWYVPIGTGFADRSEGVSQVEIVWDQASHTWSGFNATAASGHEIWWCSVTPSGASYTLSGFTIATTGQNAGSFFAWMGSGSTVTPSPPRILDSLGTVVSFESVVGGIDLVYNGPRGWTDAAGAPVQWVVSGFVPGAVGNPNFTWIKLRVRGITRGGGGGGSDPYTALIADALGASDYSGGQLGTAIMDIRDFLDLQNMQLLGIDTKLQSINNNMGAGFSNTMEWLSLIRDEATLSNTYLSQIWEVVEQFDAADPDLGTPSAFSPTAIIDGDPIEAYMSEPPDTGLNSIDFSWPRTEVTSWDFELDLSPLNFMGSSWGTFSFTVDLTFLDPFLIWIHLPILFVATMWAVGMVWEELRRY